MFVLKKIVSHLFFPLSLVLELLIIGLVWPKKGKKFLILGISFLFLFSCSPLAFVILWPLESQYRPVAQSEIQKNIKWVVVLGGGSRASNWLTPPDQLGEASLRRLLEGMRLCSYLPEGRLVLSGGDYRGLSSDARVMRQVALHLGRPSAGLVLEESSWDTQDQARLVKKKLGQEPFYLVTSASHMPRAIALFRKAGNPRPMAAPTDFHAVWEPLSVTSLFPQVGALNNTERACYEYLGFLWGWLKGYL